MYLTFYLIQLKNNSQLNLLKKEVHEHDRTLTNLRTKEFESVCVTKLFLFNN